MHVCWQVDGDESVTSDVELSHRSNHSGVATISTLGIGLLCSISTTAALLIGQLLTHFSLLGTIEARPSSPSLRHTTEPSAHDGVSQPTPTLLERCHTPDKEYRKRGELFYEPQVPTSRVHSPRGSTLRDFSCSGDECGWAANRSTRGGRDKTS